MCIRDSTSTGHEYDELIEKLKEKCALGSKEETIKIISLLPKSWSRKKICDEFKVTDYLVRLTRDLVKSQRILPDLTKKAGNPLSEEVVNAVIEFYQEDENSRVCPGKKDCISIGNKVYKQKRLLLLTLNELFVQFKQRYPQYIIGRSSFCALRPKWCVLPGSSGTHNVCVCKYHQNVKLMTEGLKINVEYKDLLDFMVCSTENEACMFNECTSCPGPDLLKEMLQNELEDLPDQISFKQWISTDRANLITEVLPVDEFFEALIEKLTLLKKHHFISKVQSKYLKQLKDTMTEEVCITLGDFAENFTFVVQDEIQSYHWCNPQVTLHPFVYYYLNDGEVCSRSLCVISDCLDHSTAAVHCFQNHLTEDVKKVAPSVTKIVYFSDGAGSQYKNKKKKLFEYLHPLKRLWSCIFLPLLTGRMPVTGLEGLQRGLSQWLVCEDHIRTRYFQQKKCSNFALKKLNVFPIYLYLCLLYTSRCV